MTGGALAIQAVLVATGVAGRAAHRFHPTCPDASEVASLFRDASPSEAATMAHAMAGTRYQNRALVEIAARRGQGLLQGCVDPASLVGLRAYFGVPVIFVGWHVGPPFGLAGAFEAIGLHALLVRRSLQFGTTATLEVAAVDGGRDDRSMAYRRALGRLRDGGAVLLAADAREVAQTAPVPCFGRARSMARGPFALARLTGAPLVPLAVRLDDDRVV
ncbi:MAG: hypothetical protein ABIT71_00115, partial [Vicinamibacteraceae bacterium]